MRIDPNVVSEKEKLKAQQTLEETKRKVALAVCFISVIFFFCKLLFF